MLFSNSRKFLNGKEYTILHRFFHLSVWNLGTVAGLLATACALRMKEDTLRMAEESAGWDAGSWSFWNCQAGPGLPSSGTLLGEKISNVWSLSYYYFGSQAAKPLIQMGGLAKSRNLPVWTSWRESILLPVLYRPGFLVEEIIIRYTRVEIRCYWLLSIWSQVSPFIKDSEHPFICVCVTPTSNSPTPSGCSTIPLKSDIIFLEIASESTG